MKRNLLFVTMLNILEFQEAISHDLSMRIHTYPYLRTEQILSGVSGKFKAANDVLQIYENNPRIPIWVMGYRNWTDRAGSGSASGTGNNTVVTLSGQVRYCVKCKRGAGDGIKDLGLHYKEVIRIHQTTIGLSNRLVLLKLHNQQVVIVIRTSHGLVLLEDTHRPTVLVEMVVWDHATRVQYMQRLERIALHLKIGTYHMHIFLGKTVKRSRKADSPKEESRI